MNAYIISADDPAWVQSLHAIPHDVYQHPGWASADEVAGFGKAAAVVASDEAGHCLMPFLRRPLPGGLWDAASPYGYSGPIWSPGLTDNSRMNLFRAVLEELRVAGCISFFARLHPLINNGVTEEIADTTDRGPTVVIDLRLSDEERRSQLRTLHRRDIAKATRAGCIASVDTNLSNLEAFADIYRDRMRKIGADESYLLNDDYFKTLKEGLTGQLILGTVTLDDRLVGGAIFTLSRDLGFVGYHLSASEELAGGLQPTKLLISYISNWAADEGFHLLHLGGGLGAAEDSLFHFKLGFSPQTRRFRTLQVVLNPETYRDLAAGMDKLSNFFPLYRAPRKEANG